jgi:hypothetical protein
MNPAAVRRIFQKKQPSDGIDPLSIDVPSKRTLTTSVFPPPRSVPAALNIDRLDELIPDFWNIGTLPSGELLLSKDQINQLIAMFTKSRREELEASYKERLMTFVDQHERALDRAKGCMTPPSAAANLSPYA